MSTLDIVRSIVGRRHKITREEMVAILMALPTDLVQASTITSRSREGRLYVGPQWVSDPADESRATARAWERACRQITCISVLPGSYYDRADNLVEGLSVRYDEPGSMHPLQRADILFAPEALEGHEYDQIGQLRKHAQRVLIVRGEPTVDVEPPKATPGWIARLRKNPRVDGDWVRIHDDGMLEMRDRNSGQSMDPADKPRFQYRVDADGGDVMTRCLPPESVGDAWQDIGVPEWEPATTPPQDNLMRDWWEAQAL